MFLRANLFLTVIWFFCFSVAAKLPDTKENSKEFSFNPSLLFNSDFYVQSNLEFTLLHELAHAVIEIHDIPVLGGQEQAADQIAVMLLLTDKRNNGALNPVVLNKLLAISGEWMLEWKAEIKNNQTVYWGTHPLTIQRFYDVTCLAYGSNPDVLESFRKDNWLPIERAWNCDLEYIKTRKALAWLVKKVSNSELDENWNFVNKNEPNKVFSGKVKIEWGEPSKQAHKVLAQKLKDFSSLKYLIEQTNQVINIKHDITIYMEPYCRVPDAWWNGETNIITVCYELLELFSSNAKLVSELVNKGLSEPQ